MPAHVIASDPLDLLTLVPELIGFEPQNSLVLVAFRGARTCGALRVDLPDATASSGQIRLWAQSALGVVRRLHDVDAVLPVVVTDEACDGGEPRGELVERLRRQASSMRLRISGPLYEACDAWGSYGGERRARGELDAARRLRRLDPDAAPVRGRPGEEVELDAVDDALVTRTATLLERLDDAGRSGESVEQVPDPVWFAGYCAGWDPDAVGPAAAALTAHVLEQPWARDVALFTWAWGRAAGRRAFRFQERWRRGGPLRDERLASALAGEAVLGRPSVSGVEHAIGLLRRVAALLPATRRAPVLSSLAWLSWALGRGSVAGGYVALARECDAGYGFAELVETMLDRSMLPQWAFGSGGTTPRELATKGSGGVVPKG